MTDFVKESIEWMKELGYSLHYQNGDGTLCSFTHDSVDDTYPSIECNDNGITLSIKTSIQVFNEDVSKFLENLYPLILGVKEELMVRSYNQNCLKILRKGEYNRHY